MKRYIPKPGDFFAARYGAFCDGPCLCVATPRGSTWAADSVVFVDLGGPWSVERYSRSPSFKKLDARVVVRKPKTKRIRSKGKA